MLQRFATSGSTFAPQIDHLILLIAILVGFWFLAAEFALFWLCFRFRRREGHSAQYITGEEKHLSKWVTWPHFAVIVCDIVILIPAILVWVNVKQSSPPAEQTVRIFSQQWAWSFQEPGPDGALDTADDIRTVGDLHVKVNATYHFELQSRDVLHSFSVPEFRLKQDAVPGRAITGWFKTTRTGTFDIQCTQMCGMGHGLMAAHIIVETPEQHAAWMKSVSNPAAVATSVVAPAPGTGASTEDSKFAEVRQ
jgi:cytochrome c oxidase subunit II